MGSVFGGSKPSAPPTPPPSRYRDEVAGVEQVPVKNPDGSITYITRQIPLTEEQQKEKEQYDKIMSEALSEIEKLSSSDYEFDEATKAQLKAYKEEQLSQLSSIQGQRERSEEEALAARGLSQSSIADSLRRQRNLDESNIKRSIDRETEMIGQDLRSQQLNYQQNLYSLAAQEEQMDAVNAQKSLANGFSATGMLNKYQQDSIVDAYKAQPSAGGFVQRTFDAVAENPLFDIFDGIF